MHRKPLSLHRGNRGDARTPQRTFGVRGGRATLPAVHWLFTGLLVGVSGATAVYTLWLVRRLFTTAPAPAPVKNEQAEAAS